MTSREAVLKVVPRMRDYIEKRNGAWWVPNPVNPKENFADKWTDKTRKAKLFFEWIAVLEREYKELLTDQEFAKIGDYLHNAFGRRDADAVMAKHPNQKHLQGSVPAVAPVVLATRKSEQPTTPKIGAAIAPKQTMETLNQRG